MNIELLSINEIKINEKKYSCFLKENKIYDFNRENSEVDKNVLQINNEPKLIGIKNVITDIIVPMNEASHILLKDKTFLINGKKYYCSSKKEKFIDKELFNLSFIEF